MEGADKARKGDIFKILGNAKDNKEKIKLLESFWLQEKRDPEENIKIIREGIEILDTGADKEKIIALQVIARAGGLPISDQFEDIFGMGSRKERKTVDYEELMDIADKCLEFILSDNGNLRLASANCLNHLRINLNGFDFVELFYNLLSLREFYEGKEQTKSIEYCLDKLYGCHSERLIESYLPLAVKKMKINVDKNNREDAIILEDFSNNLIKETEGYIPKILKLRGEHILKESMVPYVINIGLFQISYEIQKIFALANEKELDDRISDLYSKFRLSLLLKQNLEAIEKIEDKEKFICFDIDLEKNKLILTTLKSVYERFDNIRKGLSNIVNWKIFRDNL